MARFVSNEDRVKPTIKFAKMREDAVIPSKRDGDAGYDCYPCFDDDFIEIYPHETVMVNLGICSSFDDDFVFILKERGSTGTKGIGQRSGVIDSSYRGEWMCPITNENKNPIVIYKENKRYYHGSHFAFIKDTGGQLIPYTKAICQAVLLPVPKVNIQEVELDEIVNDETERGDGKLGSSGK